MQLEVTWWLQNVSLWLRRNERTFAFQLVLICLLGGWQNPCNHKNKRRLRMLTLKTQVIQPACGQSAHQPYQPKSSTNPIPSLECPGVLSAQEGTETQCSAIASCCVALMSHPHDGKNPSQKSKRWVTAHELVSTLGRCAPSTPVFIHLNCPPLRAATQCTITAAVASPPSAGPPSKAMGSESPPTPFVFASEKTPWSTSGSLSVQGTHRCS